MLPPPRRSALRAAALLLGAAALALAAEPIVVRFDDPAAAGKPPAGFTFARTGAGAPGAWVVRDGALAQTSTARTEDRFPLAIYEGGAWRDLALRVRLKPEDGEVDQAGGLIFRVKDENDYYLVRANALEDSVVFFRVVGGKRRELAAFATQVLSRAWHTLEVEAAGERFVVSFDGKRLLEVTDATLKEAGKVGLWTKSDSVTLFQDLTIEPR